MKTKILSWSLCFLWSVGIAAEAPADSSQQQVIQLDATTKLTLVGVTYGRGELWPPGLRRNGPYNPVYCPEDSIVVWIRSDHQPGRRPNFNLIVGDEANTACVTTEQKSGSHVNDSADVHSFLLAAFPRWDKQFFARARAYMQPIANGNFVITNPHPVSVVAWTPEPLPITKGDGDLEVTLTQFVAGAPAPYREGTDPARTNDPTHQCVHLNFEWRQNGQPATNWSAWPVWISDAAGNQARGLLYEYPKNGLLPIYRDRIHPTFPLVYDGYYFQPGLWQSESPWKLRLAFTRSSGFREDETVSFTNLPVRPGSEADFESQWSPDLNKTNLNFIAETTVNGVKLKLLPPLLLTPTEPGFQKHISVILYADPDTVAQKLNLMLVEATDDQGRKMGGQGGSPWAGHFSLELPNPGDNIKALNLKLALHKSRFVEFTVKPASP